MTSPESGTVAQRALKHWAVLSALLLAIAISLGLGWYSTYEGNRNTINIQASCQQEYDFATVPLTATTSKAVLNIVADAHVYYLKVCGSRAGVLPKPDPRVAAIVATKR